MPCSSSSKLTFAEVLFILILALISFPVDLTFTNNSFLKSSLSLVIIFKFFKLIESLLNAL